MHCSHTTEKSFAMNPFTLGCSSKIRKVPMIINSGLVYPAGPWSGQRPRVPGCKIKPHMGPLSSFLSSPWQLTFCFAIPSTPATTISLHENVQYDHYGAQSQWQTITVKEQMQVSGVIPYHYRNISTSKAQMKNSWKKKTTSVCPWVPFEWRKARENWWSKHVPTSTMMQGTTYTRGVYIKEYFKQGYQKVETALLVAGTTRTFTADSPFSMKQQV